MVTIGKATTNLHVLLNEGYLNNSRSAWFCACILFENLLMYCMITDIVAWAETTLALGFRVSTSKLMVNPPINHNYKLLLLQYIHTCCIHGWVGTRY